MTVVDASVVVDFLLMRESSAALVERVLQSKGDLAAPHLLDLEVTSAFRRYYLKGILTNRDCDGLLMQLSDLAIVRYPHQQLLPTIWKLWDNLTCYDACYLALAEALGGTLLTRDGAFRGLSSALAQVEIL